MAEIIDSMDSLATPFATTAERAYYRCGDIFIKRSLRPSEYITTQRGTKHIPRLEKRTTAKRSRRSTLHSTR
ncbi:hypothetical protein BJY04DRAFT_180334 [Aspergillus karnatakaensis]|uniref:uncharacterized protein n=1 Tax=Aspergillus karnatakaensis TaxID=1810916 RepID=UPI003CCCABB4